VGASPIKAALESAVVHAISPGRLATRAAIEIPEFDGLLNKPKLRLPRAVSASTSSLAMAFLAHEAARPITGETLPVDGGDHIID